MNELENAPIKASQNAFIRNVNQVIVVGVVVFCTKIQNRRITRCLVYRRECYRCFEAFSRASAEKQVGPAGHIDWHLMILSSGGVVGYTSG